jgi:hypothetical protein
MINQVLDALEEGWAKAIGSRDGIVLDGEKGGPCFILSERANKGGGLGVVKESGCNKGREIEGTESVNGLSKQIFENSCGKEDLVAWEKTRFPSMFSRFLIWFFLRGQRRRGKNSWSFHRRGHNLFSFPAATNRWPGHCSCC